MGHLKKILYSPIKPESHDDICSFLQKISQGDLKASTIHYLLKHVLTHAEDGLDIKDHEQQRIGVVLLIDQCEGEGNRAELMPYLSTTDLEQMDFIWSWAIKKLQNSSRSRLDIALNPGVYLPIEWMHKNQLKLDYTLFKMKRPAGEYPIPAHSFPSSWRWTPYDQRYLSSYYECLSLAFQNVPGTMISEPRAIHERNRQSLTPVELVMEDEKVIAFIKVDIEKENGELSILGRHPDYVGQGLGEHLVFHGLNILDTFKVKFYELEVAAKNRQAIGLYTSFGFEVIDERPVYSYQLS
jgi:ribosomal protein S18 acetylase RimI-like enzyme